MPGVKGRDLPNAQVKGQHDRNVMAVFSGGAKGGPMVFGVKSVNNETAASKPQPKPRTRPEPLPSKPPPPPAEEDHDQEHDHVISHTTATALSPGLASRLSQDLSNAVMGFRPKQDRNAGHNRKGSDPVSKFSQDDRSSRAATLPSMMPHQPVSQPAL